MAGYKGVDPEVLKQFIKASGLKHHQTAKSWIFTCPRCSGSKKLWVIKDSGYFKCWKCAETDGYKGKCEYAFADLLHQSVKSIRTRLYGGADVHVDLLLDVRLKDFGDDDELDPEAHQLLEVDFPCDYYPIEAPESVRGAAYLMSRGIPVEVAAQYGVRYAPALRRVVFPVEDHGSLWGWQGRLIIPTKHVDPDGRTIELNKIESSPGIPRDRTLMFADRLRGARHAILTEGPLDAMKCHTLGGNVCAMGKAVTPQQMQLLLYAGVERVYLGLDPDAAVETARLVKNYFGDVELYNLQAPGAGKVDLGGMEFGAVEELFHAARRIQPGHLFVFLKSPVEFTTLR